MALSVTARFGPSLDAVEHRDQVLVVNMGFGNPEGFAPWHEPPGAGLGLRLGVRAAYLAEPLRDRRVSPALAPGHRAD